LIVRAVKFESDIDNVSPLLSGPSLLGRIVNNHDLTGVGNPNAAEGDKGILAAAYAVSGIGNRIAISSNSRIRSETLTNRKIAAGIAITGAFIPLGVNR